MLRFRGTGVDVFSSRRWTLDMPFLILQSSRRQPNFLVESDSNRATRASSTASSSSSTLSIDVPTVPISQHARYRAPSPHLPANIPAGELRVRESLGREADGAASSSRSGIPRPTTRRGGENVRTLRNPPGGHPSGDRTNLENSRNMISTDDANCAHQR